MIFRRHTRQLFTGLVQFCLSISLSMLPAYAVVVIEGDAQREENFAPRVLNIESPQQQPTINGTLTVPWTLPNFQRSGNTGLQSLIQRGNPNLSWEQVQGYARLIEAIASSHGLDPRLMASLVCVESSFRWDAVSRTGAQGLGQLKPATAKWLGVNNAFDPVDNLYGVAKYMRFLMDRYQGSVQHALAAYFQGQGTIDRRGIDWDAARYVSKIARVFNDN